MTRSGKFMVLPLVVSLTLAGCLGRKKNSKPDVGSTAEPDKVLYERAKEDLRKGHYEVARLTLQTLMNTYPDSEYLAKAKLAIADSYFKEGGTSGLTQAVAEYKDFETFFPFLDEAAYAQMQVGMAHFRRLEKPDRDRTEGRLAEEEFQVFLQKYPQSPLAPQVEQRLREVQEVLAEGDFRIAHFYYVKGSMRAAGARLMELTSRYPLYSQADKANWMLGNVFERAEKGDQAAQYYARIARDYPLSPLVDDAKARLTKLGVPVPPPNPESLARMQREREMERQRPGLFRHATGMLRSGPDVSMAARTGNPTLASPSDTYAATETLKPSGNKMNLGGGGSRGSGGSTVVVETVSPGSPTSTASTPPVPAKSETAPQADASSTASNVPPASSEVAKAPEQDKKDATQNKKEDDKKGKESSSKKKKGLRKIVPW